MPETSLNFRAYKDVKWQDIANDLHAYSDALAKQDNRGSLALAVTLRMGDELNALRIKLSGHQLMFHEKGCTNPATIAHMLPREFKSEIANFSKSLAATAQGFKSRLADWDYIEKDEKITLLQDISDAFRQNTGFEGMIKLSRANSDNCSSGIDRDNNNFTVNMSGDSLDESAVVSLKSFCHEMWHVVTFASYEATQTMPEMKTPADVLKAMNAAQAGFFDPEDLETLYFDPDLYELQVTEATALASEAYFQQAFKDLNKRGGRNRGGNKPKPDINPGEE